jgi:RHS repeat-associated protein
LTNVFPNGLRVERGYGGNLEDRELQRITHKVGTTPISEFLYGRDHLADRITTWSQQAGVQSPDLHTFGYDDADQLLSATVTNSGTLINTFAYSYDPLGNRLTEQVGASNCAATYNALNQISTTTAPGASRTNEWDAKDRLVAVNVGNQRTEFAYDGMDRMVSIRQLTNSSEASYRRFVWCDNGICEERDAAGAVTKRFFEQGMRLETGPNLGSYFYTRDHLGTVRELIDVSGQVRSFYAYEPYGRRVQKMGEIKTDFGFAGMFEIAEAGLTGTRFRNYDSGLGRWLSRDPLDDAEIEQGANLYAYVRNNPVNVIDPMGLCCEKERERLDDAESIWYDRCSEARYSAGLECALSALTPATSEAVCAAAFKKAENRCKGGFHAPVLKALEEFYTCARKPCKGKVCKPLPPQPLLDFAPPKTPKPSLPPLCNPITGECRYIIFAE